MPLICTLSLILLTPNVAFRPPEILPARFEKSRYLNLVPCFQYPP